MIVGDIIQIAPAGDESYSGEGEVREFDSAGWVLVRATKGGWDGSFWFRMERCLLQPPFTHEMKPTNPKDAIGSDKLPLHLWPETASAYGCLGLLEGALKYGRNNWRETGVRATIYIDALKRHINSYAEGEDTDPDSGMPHLSHALACLAILVDSKAAGKLNDDRNYPGGYHALVKELTTLVPQAKEHHADKSPKHWTIQDA